ncbi:MAG: ribbon-helix-helix domain-containing protein, partial [Spirochaetes bacterium]|nr:ribbon-helix-helix domain-containing protein [Spirochaetota bacterium]
MGNEKLFEKFIQLLTDQFAQTNHSDLLLLAQSIDLAQYPEELVDIIQYVMIIKTLTHYYQTHKEQLATDKVNFKEFLSLFDKITEQALIKTEICNIYKKFLNQIFLNTESYKLYQNDKGHFKKNVEEVTAHLILEKHILAYYFIDYIIPGRITIYDMVIQFLTCPISEKKQNYKELQGSLFYHYLPDMTKKLISYHYQKITGQEQKTQIALTIDKKDKQALLKKARSLNKSVSQIITEAINHYLK